VQYKTIAVLKAPSKFIEQSFETQQSDYYSQMAIGKNLGQ